MSAMPKDADALLEAFDAGEDMGERFDLDRPEFPNREVKRVNVDFPVGMATALDGERAKRVTSRPAAV